jgi:zinc transport system ATP-binding protein
LSELLTLEARAARIDLLGLPLVVGLSLSSSSERLALLGDWSALFRLLAGEARLVAGQVELCGVPADQAVVRGQVGLGRLDPLLPAAWSAEQFLMASGELAGLSSGAARRAVGGTFEKLSLGTLAPRRLAHLQLAERRALLVAHALLTDPQVICLEQPLIGLDVAAEQLLSAVIERAAAGRRLIVSLAGPEHSRAERELLERAGAALRLHAGAVHSVPSDAATPRQVVATICRNHEAFANALAARGMQAQATHEAGVLGTLTSASAGPAWRYVIQLVDGSTAPVLDAALETEAGLIELVPG